MQLHGTIVRIAVSLFLVPIVALVFQGTSRQNRAQLADVSPQATLKPTTEGSAEQARVLQSIVRQLQLMEEDSREGDAYFKIATKVGPIPKLQAVLRPKTKLTRWAFNAGRIRYESRLLSKDDEKTNLKEFSEDDLQAVYDGSYTYEFHPATQEGSLSTGKYGACDSVQETWLTLTTSGGKPISEMVKMPGAKYEGRELVGSTECLKIGIPYASGKLEIWLSPSNGYRAKKIVYSSPTPEAFSLYSIDEVETFQQTNGIWFPSKGKGTRFRQDNKTGKRDLRDSVEWTVVSFSTETPDHLFHLEFPIGARVFDSSGKKSRTYIIGQDGGQIAPLQSPGG